MTRPATACSLLASAEPLAGTAPRASAWMVVEQAGAYGAKALTESDFPSDVGMRITTARKAAGVGALLARRPASHRASDNRVWLAASSRPGSPMLVGAHIDAGDVAHVDLTDLAAGIFPDVGQASSDPWLFVCTNGRRDLCCGRAGREAIQGAADDHVMECSHVGGHRFAATGVLLPWGYVYGRLTTESVAAVMAAARSGTIHAHGLRGRSTLPPTAQAAEIAVRQFLVGTGPEDLSVLALNGDEGPRPLAVFAPTGPPVLQVRHVDGRVWTVRTRMVAVAPGAPESCGGADVSRESVEITDIEAAPAWR